MAALVLPALRGGDAIFFWGTGFLSDSIKALTAGPSHVATVLDPDVLLPDGSRQTELHVIESTILKGANGVQINKLADRVNDYDRDGCIAAACLSDRWHGFLDWGTAWKTTFGMIGDRYNIGEIAAYVANLVLPAELGIDAPAAHASVCSEFRADLLRAAGLPGLDPYRTAPTALWRMKMYGAAPYVYRGTIPAGDLRTFNTV